jgi:DNA-binding LytR/AlgR family response regulator
MKILFEECETAAAQQIKEIVSGISPEVEVVKIPSLFSRLLRMTFRDRPPVQRYLVRKGTRLFPIAVDDIAYFYVKGRFSCIRTVCDTEHIIEKSLDEIEQEVDKTVFFRINRQFIVNYSSIRQVHAWFNGKLKVWLSPAIEEEIIVSRLKAAEFRRWLGE